MTGVLVLLITGFVVVMISHEKRTLDRYNRDLLSEISGEFSRILDLQTETLSVLSEVILQDENLIVLLKNRDRQQLLKTFEPMYTELCKKHGITHLYFHDPNRVNLLRVHTPEKYGDLINRSTARQAERTGRTTSGIELGPLGTFTLRVVRPVFRDDKLMGYLELGKEIEDILKHLGSKQNIELAVTIHKNVLTQEKWQEGMAVVGRHADWNRFKDEVLIYSTLSRLSTQVDGLVREEGYVHGNVTSELTFENRTWRVMVTELSDVSGSKVGDLIIFNDVSKLNAAFTRMLTLTLAIALVLLGGLLVILDVILRRTDQGIQRQQRQLEESHRRFRILFERSPDAIMTLSPATWKFTSGNAAAIKMFGADNEAHFKSCEPWRLSPEIQPDGQSFVEGTKRMIETAMQNESCCFEWIHKRINGEEFPATVILTYVQIGEELFFLVTVRDITEQKKAEKQVVEYVTSLEQAKGRAEQEKLKLSAMIFQMEEGVVFADANDCIVEVSNAIKFTDQGYVHLKVSLQEDNGTPFIRFDVEDTGVGIPEKRQQVIFDSFTQADESTTRKYGGTGLGLTVTKQLTELLGGYLTVTSAPEKGSVFSLVIPAGVDVAGQPLLDRTRVTDLDSDESQITHATQFSGKVLVAEDVPGNQQLMKLILSKQGVEVVIAKDGEQAVDEALSQSFDLILMDMHMPIMDGYEATRQIRKAESVDCGLRIWDLGLRHEIRNPKSEIKRVPIVALTANAMKGDDLKCLEAGCDDYLPKPIDRRELPRVLARYLPAAQDVTGETINSVPLEALEPEKSGAERTAPEALLHESNDVDCLSDIINWDQLIERLGDEDIIREIIPAYIEDTKDHFEKLSQALKLGDCPSIAFHAHALKGVSRNLDIKRLGDITSQMERAGRENDIETVTLLYSSAEAEVDRVLESLSQPGWIEKVKMTVKRAC